MSADLDAVGVQPVAPQVTEQAARFLPGMQMLVLGIAVLLAGAGIIIGAAQLSGAGTVVLIIVAALVLVAGALVLRGLTAVVPGQARVVQLFGRYRGTIRDAGLQW